MLLYVVGIIGCYFSCSFFCFLKIFIVRPPFFPCRDIIVFLAILLGHSVKPSGDDMEVLVGVVCDCERSGFMGVNGSWGKHANSDAKTQRVSKRRQIHDTYKKCPSKFGGTVEKFDSIVESICEGQAPPSATNLFNKYNGDEEFVVSFIDEEYLSSEDIWQEQIRKNFKSSVEHNDSGDSGDCDGAVERKRKMCESSVPSRRKILVKLVLKKQK